jgi:signal transduction histidine kinase
VHFWNLCLEEWTGIARGEILGHNIVERFKHLGTPLYRDRLQMIFSGGSPTIFSSQLHPHLLPAPLPDGQLRIQHTVVTAIPHEGNGGPGKSGFDALLSIQDVTDPSRRLEETRRLRDQALQEIQERQRSEKERRRLEAKIQQTQKLESLGAMAGGLAHDLNNLLVGILGNADLARSELPEGSGLKTRLDAVIASGQRAAVLSNQMLAYSGKGDFITRPLNLSHWVHDIVRLLKIELPNNVVLRCKLPRQLPIIEADPAQIRQLVSNLLLNACDALEGESGLVTLSTYIKDCDHSFLERCYLEDLPTNTYVVFEISDTGCGMDDATQEKIFDPFFTTKFAGRGLGMAAALGIVRGHRGTLRVESDLDQGTTVRVLFPIAQENSAEAPPPLPPETPWRGAGTILLIDDEAIVRELAQATLERAGFQILTAKNGPEGLEIFRHHADHLSLVILDLTMPEMGGEEVYRKLRHQHPNARVLLSSGYSEHQAARLFTNPLSAFLKKPYQPAQLVEKVREVLGG